MLKGVKKAKDRRKKVAINDKWPDKWTHECETAFEQLKLKLINAPLLKYPDFDKPFYLETDASIIGYGAILYQMEGRKKEVIAYASRKLKQAEQTIKAYSAMKIEFLAMHWAITKKFKDYLYGAKHQFLVLTDNHPLSRMLKAKQTAADMGKLADLADYNFKLEYKSGKTNIAADALSRNPINDNSDSELQAEITAYICEHSADTSIPDEVLICVEPEVMTNVIQQSVNEIHISTSHTYQETQKQHLQQRVPHISRILEFMNNGMEPEYKE